MLDVLLRPVRDAGLVQDPVFVYVPCNVPWLGAVLVSDVALVLDAVLVLVLDTLLVGCGTPSLCGTPCSASC